MSTFSLTGFACTRWESRLPQAGEDAHHIIPAVSANNSIAMQVLYDVGIHPNSAFNGVGLPEAFHRGTGGSLHDGQYIEAVEVALSNLDNPADVLRRLDDIAFILDDAAIRWENGEIGIEAAHREVKESIRALGGN